MSIRAKESFFVSQCPARELTWGSTQMSAMKQVVFSLVLLTIMSVIVSAQTQSRQRLPSEQSNPNESNTVRNRVVGPKASNHADSQKPRPSAGTDGSSTPRTSTFTWGNTAIPEQTPRVSATSNNSSVGVAEP
jgi:hypothetical protein